MLELCKDEELKCWSDKIFRSELDIEADRFVNISYSFVGSVSNKYFCLCVNYVNDWSIFVSVIQCLFGLCHYALANQPMS